jgi:thioredoxin 1
MASIELTQENFGQAIDKDGITLVDFWAEWCGPCKMFGPIFEAASEKHPEIVFGKVDTEAQQQLANQANITSIPTLMVFRDGILLYNSPGALPEQALNEIIVAVKNLDMEEVRKELAKQEAERLTKD